MPCYNLEALCEQHLSDLNQLSEYTHTQKQAIFHEHDKLVQLLLEEKFYVLNQIKQVRLGKTAVQNYLS